MPTLDLLSRVSSCLYISLKCGHGCEAAWAFSLFWSGSATPAAMKLKISSRTLAIPKEVSIEVKGRAVRVKGPRGVLTKDFRHIAVDMFLTEVEGVKTLNVDAHFAKRKQLASIRTVISHVQNLITGVTKGFEYKMRLVYAHFPININVEKKGDIVEIRNFLGEKRVRVVNMLPGVKIARSEAVKDELIISGSDKENVSRSCSLISQSCLVRCACGPLVLAYCIQHNHTWGIMNSTYVSVLDWLGEKNCMTWHDDFTNSPCSPDYQGA